MRHPFGEFSLSKVISNDSFKQFLSLFVSAGKVNNANKNFLFKSCAIVLLNKANSNHIRFPNSLTSCLRKNLCNCLSNSPCNSPSNRPFNIPSNSPSNRINIIKREDFESLESILRADLILLCGDVELNPGPHLHSSTSNNQRPSSTSTSATPTTTSATTTWSSATTEPSNQTLRQRSALQVTSMNVRGLGDTKKVRHLVNNCYKLCSKAKDNVFMFQETYVTSLSLLNYIWRGEFHLTPGLGNSVGCITLLSAPFKVIYKVDIANRGHILAVTRNNINKADFILVNIYAPNGLDNQKTDFFEEVVNKTGEARTLYDCSTVILAGDLNIVFKSDEVKNRNLSAPEIRVANIIKQSLNSIDLIDGWDRAAVKSFTWTATRNGRQSFSILDRILFSDGKLVLKDKSANWALSISDHAAVTALFDPPDNQPNDRTFVSRLDPNALDDPECVALMNASYEELMANALPTWDPHTALEYCKMSIRTAANMATGKMKAGYRDQESILNEDINKIITDLSEMDDSAADYALYINKLDDLRALKRQLISKIGTKLERRTARKWYNEGELSNKYFFNLLNRKSNDEINSIMVDGEESTDKQVIEDSVRSFYKNLYENIDDSLTANDEFFNLIDRVDPNRAAELTVDFTLEELYETLSHCTDSAPGPDGIPYSYLKHYWQSFGPILLKAWKFSLQTQALPPSHKISFLRLIPKVGKDSRLIGNLRPITLSNTDHKLITKAYSKRLTAIVSDLIGQEQTAYIPGRLINDNIRSMLMTLDLANSDNDVDGSIISLDAKKAFDSVDHRYIARCLEAFGLANFVPIFRVLYKELRSDIILNGKVINGYQILKGVKQGDALSCILFIMCIEPLIRNIKNNPRIQPITSTKMEINIPKVYTYADDVNVVTRTNDVSVQEVFNEYQRLTNVSGLVLNAEKTEILRFKKLNRRERNYQFRYNNNNFVIASKDRIKINGIIFHQDTAKREDLNVEKVEAAMTTHLRQWSRRHLTLLGKILILKTFAISQAIYLMQSLTLSDNSIKRMNMTVFKFLWNKNFNAPKAPDRLRRSIVTTSTDAGGFGMIDLNVLQRSLDLRSYGRLLESKHPFLGQLTEIVKSSGFFNVSVQGALIDGKLRASIKLINDQRRQILGWPREHLLNEANLIRAIHDTKLVTVLTPAGRNSLTAFSILSRNRRIRISELTANEITNLARHFSYPELPPILASIRGNPVPLNNSGILAHDLYPTKDKRVLKLSTLTSKDFRKISSVPEDELICLYKSGMVLQPGEVLHWTRRVKKLTSTRHKNIILRVAHGDLYTNDRLCRFGLLNEPKCFHCDEPIETLTHRLLTCSFASRAWQSLNNRLRDLGLSEVGNLTVENILGAGEQLTKIDLAIRAELTIRLASGNNIGSCPNVIVTNALKMIALGENLPLELRRAFQNIT